jgi:hypothetical protein
MPRTAAIVLVIAVLPMGCALVGYSFDGYGPAGTGTGEGGSASSGQSTTGSSAGSGGSGTGSSSSSAEGSSSSTGSGPLPCMTPAECGTSTECIAYACLNSSCSPTITLPGTPCNNASGFCNLMGQCVQCLGAGQCPPAVNQCQIAVCNGGVCGIGNKPAATLCNGTADQCDGAGNCVDCVNSGGCEECCVCSNQVCIPS